MFQSQTGSQALSDADASASSGAKLLFQSQTGSQALSDLCPPEEMDEKMSSVSIPNGKSGPLRLPVYEAHRQAVNEFQSQTGSQALSDAVPTEGRSSGYLFQSQTGSQALSDLLCLPTPLLQAARFNPKREVRPSQTQIPSTSTCQLLGFNPKREVRPSQTMSQVDQQATVLEFQSQTGSQALSDVKSVIISSFLPCGFQSQTGSQALSDRTRYGISVRISKRFNPKREVRPSQTSPPSK